MKRTPNFTTSSLRRIAACVVLFGASYSVGHAGITNISSNPMDSGSANSVPPNLLFVLDDSGSMDNDYLPDQISGEKTCKTKGVMYKTGCGAGDPPFHAAEFNGIAYNPQITYSPGVNYLGVSLGSQTVFTAVSVDPYTSNTKINLTTKYPDLKYCVSSVCARNGVPSSLPSVVGTGVTFNYNSTSGYPDAVYTSSSNITGAAYYYTIAPLEYCSDDNLTTCTLSTVPTGAFVNPAPVRYCQSSAYGTDIAAVSGLAANSKPKCQRKHDPSTGYNFVFPRYGQFTRVDIVPATVSYGNRPLRSDCAAKPTCSYTEEMTNFANWYAYYRTRLNMMKTVAGQVFQSLDANYRVGFITINPTTYNCSGGSAPNPCPPDGTAVSNTKFQPISEFTPAQKSAWYTMFYSQKTNGSTPLRPALSRAGRYYAGKHDHLNAGMNDDPVLYACQQNFTLLTTDGYWNQGGGVKLDGTTAIGNQDNVNSGRSARNLGVFDGASNSASDTLADVAQYYYVTDLRPAGSTNLAGVDVSAPIVPKVGKDDNEEQHMTTFTLGLVDGLMRFRPDYETASTGDYAAIKTASTGCSWIAGTCNWPVPAQNDPSALDDLWHAAVNGRGSFYQASDPSGLVAGLASSLAGLKATVASSAAAAVSTPLITQTDNFVFSSTYTTIDWTGELIAETLDPITGALNTTPVWSTQSQLDAAVTANSDTRTIWMFDSTAPISKLKSFDWASLSATEKLYFQNKCVPSSNLTQCAVLSASALSTINGGDSMVGYLRGWTQNLATIFRDRKHVLGDPVNSNPAFIAAPSYGFADVVTPNYGTFKTANASRSGTIYFGGNDGMLHAINASNGAERWAYVPKVTMPNLYKLADKNYGTHHIWLVDGSPGTMDIFDGSAWKTILVGSFNGGGRGYFALDVTDPNSPKGLWEICSSSTECAISDTDMGLSFSTPIITKRAVDGKWVVLVTSGYNNVSPGTGYGYFYVLDALTGAVLSKISTVTGSTTTPSGLGRLSAWADSVYSDNTAKYAYAGDLQGNVWRIDLTVNPPTLLHMGKAVDAALVPQPITTKVELSKISGNRVVFVGTGKMLGDSDINDPVLSGINESYQQSMYAFKDDGVDHGTLRSAGLIQQSISNVTSSTRTTTANSVNWASDTGYYLDFNPGNSSPGERVVVDPQVALGVLTFATNIPTLTTSCGTAGDSWFYTIDVKTGAPIPGYPSAVKNTGMQIVGYVLVQLPNGSVKIVFNYNKKQGVGDAPTNASSTKGKRTSWRELIY